MKLHFFMALNAEAEAKVPLWKELWSIFYDACFGTPTYYEHLNFGTGSLLSVRLLVAGIFIGLAIGAFVAVFNKQTLGDFVRKLLREECLSPERAKTFPELDYAAKLSVRRAVRKNVNLRRVVRCREEEEFLAAQGNTKKTPTFRVDPDTHHFYIPEEMKYMADIKFDAKGTTWPSAFAFAFLMIVLMFVVLTVLPYLMSLLNDFVGMIQA